MAEKTKGVETVEVPAATLAALQARLDQLERREAERAEAAHRPTVLLDDAFQRWKDDVSRPAPVRTQEAADRKYGTSGRRWKVRLDSTTPDGKPGPNVSEHPALVISANSDLEAVARWQEITGVRKHDYRVIAEPVAA